MKDPRHHLSPNLQAHEGAPKRETPHELTGPVHGIDPPLERRRVLFIPTVFLAAKLVGREGLPQDVPNEAFSLPVRLGHGGAIDLLEDLEFGPKIAKRPFSPCLGGLSGDGKEPSEFARGDGGGHGKAILQGA
jgi:hypothetical protein